MRRLLVALAIAGVAALVPTSTVGDSDLTQLVNAAYFPRSTDSQLHSIAHERAVEISTDFSHSGQRPGVAEVLAWNSGFSDPLAHVIGQWQGSPVHDSILSDPNLTLIGCAAHVVGNVTYAACVLSWGGSPPPQEPVPDPPAEVPLATPAPTPESIVQVLPDAATDFCAKRSTHPRCTSTPSPTSVPVPSATPSPIPSPTASATVAPTPSAPATPTASATPSPLATPAPPTSVVKRVAVLLIQHPDDPSPFTQSEARAMGQQVAAYYDEVSYGKVDMTFEVFGPVTVNEGTTCAYATWISDALAALNLDRTQYTNVMGIGTGDGCTFAGVASSGGWRSYLNNRIAWGTAVHELGHNYGLSHASGYNCTANGVRVTISTSCTTGEYSDVQDRMGSANGRHFSTHYRYRLGYLTPVAVTSDRTMTIGVAAQAGASNKLVHVPRGDGSYLTLEFRQPFGIFETGTNMASNDTRYQGVTVRLLKAVNGVLIPSKTYLLDMGTSTTGFHDAALLPGRTFTDLNRLRITVNSVSSSGANVTIDLP